MANRGSAFLLFRRGYSRRVDFRRCSVAGLPLLRVGAELVLPLQLQFQLDLVQFLLQALVCLEQPITASLFSIDPRVQRPPRQFLLIRHQY
jgi:hypothetical protein